MAFKAAGRCSECGEKLLDSVGRPKPAGTKTCSKPCRQKRARRLKQQKVEQGKQSKYEPEHQEMAAAVRGEMKDAAHEAAVDEFRPLVREAMTADVLAGINTLIGSTPRAIQLLQDQMESSDEVIAQRAVTLLLKYTMGNPSVAPAPTVQAPSAMSVTFNIPRPGDTTSESSVTLESSEPEELRECQDCHTHKGGSEFVASSDRCKECFESLRDTVTQRFTKPDASAP